MKINIFVGSGETNLTSKITMDLYKDWVETAREVFRGAGQPLPDDATFDQVAAAYYRQTMDETAAGEAVMANKRRFVELELTIRNNFDLVILPDIRARTKYQGDTFRFRWVYLHGEHIVEDLSEYRIPL
jgi:hypothetical protein